MLQKIVLVIVIISSVIGGLLLIEHGINTSRDLATYYAENQEEWNDFVAQEESKSTTKASLSLSVEKNTIIYRYDYDSSFSTTEAQIDSDNLIDNTDVEKEIIMLIQETEKTTGVHGITIQKEFYNSDGDYINGEQYSI